MVVRSQALGPVSVSSSQQLFEQFLIAQRSEYCRSLPGKVAQIAAHWRSIASDGADREVLVELERLSHTLAGTAGTLGFVATGKAAQALELLVQRAMQDAAGWAALHPEIEQALGNLQNSLPRTDPAPTDILAGTPADTSRRAKDAG